MASHLHSNQIHDLLDKAEKLSPLSRLDSYDSIHAKLESNFQTKHLLCAVFFKASRVSLENLRSNMMESQSSCDWVVLVYDGSLSLVKGIEGLARQGNVNLAGVIYETNVSTPNSSTSFQLQNKKHSTISQTLSGTIKKLLKPSLYLKVQHLLRNYQRVWFIDDDLSLIGFRFDKYFRTLNCIQTTTNKIPNKETPLISQPLITGHQQHFDYLNSKNWTKNSIIASSTGFIEQQTPIFDTQFFNWFLNGVIRPLMPVVLLLEADWGFDAIWCTAATQFAIKTLNYSTNYQACAIIIDTPPVKHLHQSWTTVLNAKGLIKGKGRLPQSYYDDLNDKLVRNNKLISILNRTFPSWYKSGDDPLVDPHYIDQSSGKSVWKKFYELPGKCTVNVA